MQERKAVMKRKFPKGSKGQKEMGWVGEVIEVRGKGQRRMTGMVDLDYGCGYVIFFIKFRCLKQ